MPSTSCATCSRSRRSRRGQIGVDDAFLDKIRLPAEDRAGVSIERYLGKMDRAGIERSLLIAVRAGDLRIQGSFAISVRARRRGLRRASRPLLRPGRHRPEPRHGRRARAGAGGHATTASSARTCTRTGSSCRRTTRGYYPFYAKCCELDIPIMMQVGHCLDYQRDRVLPSVGRPILLDRVAIDFPELKLIGIHIGWPWTDEMIAVAYKHENVYIGSRRLRAEALAGAVRPLRQHATAATRCCSAPTGR